MQWKRFGRCLICLLVVVALLINMVPQKAEASGLGMAAAGAGTLVAAPSLPVIAAIVMGLGVLVAVSTVDWDSVVRKCQNYLINKGVIDEEGTIQIVKFDFSGGGSVNGTNGPIFENAIGFAASQSLIEMIRDWLFEEEIVSVDTSSEMNGFSFSSMYTCSDNFTYLVRSPSDSDMYYKCMLILDSLSFSEDLFVFFAESKSLAWGLYFNDKGQLRRVGFNPNLNAINSSLFGVIPLDSVTPIYDYPVKANYNWDYYIYYSIEYADADTSDPCYSLFDLKYASGDTTFPLMHRGTSGVWASSRGNILISRSSSSFTHFYPDYSTFSYDESITYSPNSSYDVTLGEIASPETSLDEGYSTWYGNAISVPGSDVGSDDDYVPYWPIGLGQTYEETQTFTQEQIWAGESTYVDTSTDTGTDTDTGVSTGTFADTLVGDFLISLGEIIMTPFEWLLEGVKAIFVPSEDFLSAKVEALRKNFLFADSIITAWESLRSAFTEFETEPPVIYMELSNSESDIDYGSRAIALDLTWYERYKPTVDTLLSSLLWIWFVWRVFRKLPGIISGMPGDTPDVPVSDGHFYGYAEGRKRLPGGSIKRR